MQELRRIKKDSETEKKRGKMPKEINVIKRSQKKNKGKEWRKKKNNKKNDIKKINKKSIKDRRWN